MSIVVFWLEEFETDSLAPALVQESRHKEFKDNQLSEALAFMGTTRTKHGTSHVSMCTELEGTVGTKDAGGAVVDGKLPDGSAYTWMKRRNR